MHELQDLPATHRLWSTPEVFQYISGKPSTLAQSAGRLYNYRGHWEFQGYGYLVVEHKTTQAFMGEVGIANFYRDLEPKMDSPFEVGWVFSPEYHGKGYAQEAVQALLSWHQQQFTGAQYWCVIHPNNKASIKLSERLNFHKTHEAIMNSERVNVYQMKTSKN